MSWEAWLLCLVCLGGYATPANKHLEPHVPSLEVAVASILTMLVTLEQEW